MLSYFCQNSVNSKQLCDQEHLCTVTLLFFIENNYYKYLHSYNETIMDSE